MYEVVCTVVILVALFIFLATLFIGEENRIKMFLYKLVKVISFNSKGWKMTDKKKSLKKSEAKVLAATMIKDLIEEELHDQEAMETRLEELNLTESGERKFLEAIDDLLAVVLKKAKLSAE